MEEIIVKLTKTELMSLNAAFSIIETLAPSITNRPNVRSAIDKLLESHLTN